MQTVISLVIIILLLVANGFFVAVEFALVAADRSRLETLASAGSWPAKAALSARGELSFHLSGAQLGITVTSLVLGFLVNSLVGPMLEPLTSRVPLLAGPTMSVLFALAVISAVQMVIGELFPKAVAISAPEPTALALAPIAVFVHGLLRPAIGVLNGAANWLVARFGIEPQDELDESISWAELEELVKESREGGALAVEASRLLTRTIRFGDKTAADALCPRLDVEAIASDATVEGLINTVRSSNYSRFPVYEQDLDNVIGVVAVTSVFGLEAAKRSETLVTSLMGDPLFVPETRLLTDIIDDFQSGSAQMAIVVDEHGGTAGILTLEDVLEEIVGEIDDEYDDAEVLTTGVMPGVYLLAGTLHADEVEEACGFVIPEGDYETIAGFLLDGLGRIPKVGDSILSDGWHLEVAEMDRLRIASIQLVKPVSEP